MKKNRLLYCILLCLLTAGGIKAGTARQKLMDVGIGRVDITPEQPIRLTGYSDRNTSFASIHHRLWAKALAFGNAKTGYSMLITVDLLGIPGRITDQVRKVLAKELNIRPENVTIMASHTHSGPQIGNIISHFDKPLSPDELAEVVLYSQGLVPKLRQAALQAVGTVEPSLVYRGEGEVGFAINRRLSINPDGPVDHTMPFMKVTKPDGTVRAIFATYACHAVTLGPKNNVVHGDWVGEAQLQIEENLPPGAMAMIGVGCGADQNSNPRMNNKNPEMDLENARKQGRSIAEEVKRLINSPGLMPVQDLPQCKLKYIDLDFASMPDPLYLARDAKGAGRTSNYSNLLLGRMARSEMPDKISYPIQVWHFGKNFSMIFLAGEVVVDYSLRLKKELGRDRIWVNSYANDMPCYIPSLRVLKEGGYEAESAMIGYEKPSKFTEDVEERIITAIYELMGSVRVK